MVIISNDAIHQVTFTKQGLKEKGAEAPSGSYLSTNTRKISIAALRTLAHLRFVNEPQRDITIAVI